MGSCGLPLHAYRSMDFKMVDVGSDYHFSLDFNDIPFQETGGVVDVLLRVDLQVPLYATLVFQQYWEYLLGIEDGEYSVLAAD